MKFTTQPSASEIATLMTILVSTSDGVEVGRIYLESDHTKGQIWAVDVDGRDVMVATSSGVQGARRAIGWALDQQVGAMQSCTRAREFSCT